MKQILRFHEALKKNEGATLQHGIQREAKIVLSEVQKWMKVCTEAETYRATRQWSN